MPQAPSKTPTAILICGANGFGKTTFARQLIPMTRPAVDFFNVDEIQRSVRPPVSSVAVAREFLDRLARAERNRGSFGLETTLATHDAFAVGKPADTTSFSISSSCHQPILPSNVSPGEWRRVDMISPSLTSAAASTVAATSSLRYTAPSCPSTSTG